MCLYTYRAGHLESANIFLLNAETKDYSLPEVQIEWAEYKKTQVLLLCIMKLIVYICILATMCVCVCRGGEGMVSGICYSCL